MEGGAWGCAPFCGDCSIVGGGKDLDLDLDFDLEAVEAGGRHIHNGRRDWRLV